MGKSDFQYSGTDNLEVMADAINYNKYLVGLLTRDIERGDKILDFGAGIGTFAKALRDRGYEVLCVEADGKQRERVSKERLMCVESLREVMDDSVTFVYSLNVLEHIKDDIEILSSLYRILMPGGQLLIYVPAFMCLFSAMDKKVGHERRYLKSDLTGKLMSAGFEIRRARYADSLGFFISLLFRFIGNSSGNIDRRMLIVYDRLLFPISRILDTVFSAVFGKNLVVLARKLPR